MAALRTGALGLAVLVGIGAAVSGAEPVELRESVRPGTTTQVVTTLKAEGYLRPGVPPGTTGPKIEVPKPLALKVETRIDFTDRVLQVEPPGRPARSARWVRQAAAAINGEVRPSAPALRPEVALLVAELRGGKVVVCSPAGPLTRPELELTQDVGDPLILSDLLPDHPVAVGDHWPIGADAARGLSGYDVLAGHGLKATLETLDDGTARIAIAGPVRGAVFGGGEGTIDCTGSCTFDRKSGLISKLSLVRDENRKAGEVEDGVEMKSTLTVARTPADVPPALADSALAGLPAAADPVLEELLYVAPDGRFTVRHDRDWHIYQESNRLTVLKRLDRGEVVAYCNLGAGPNAGKGRHQDPKQFRDDLRRALGERFREFLGEGEIEGDPAGGYRYKVTARGRQGDLNILWHYYLVAGPEGDQLLGTFTLADKQVKVFADQDTKIIGSLRWQTPAEKSTGPRAR